MEDGTDHLHIVVVKGSSYEMGYAYGQLMADEIKGNIHDFWKYYENDYTRQLKEYIPEFLAKSLIKLGRVLVNGLIGLDRLFTRRWTPKRITEELKGISDGSGIGYREIMLTNLVPEIIKAACTIVGAWGPASKDGNLYQLRALDWNQNAPINRYPTIVVYQPSEEGSNVYSNIGYAGLIAVLTGFSPKLAIGEKVWMVEAKKIGDRFGEPWPYVLKRVL